MSARLTEHRSQLAATNVSVEREGESVKKSEFVKVLKDWRSRIEPFQEEMGIAASRLQRKHYMFGVPSVILSTSAAATMFSSSGAGEEAVVPAVVVGTVSLLAAILAAVVTFFSHAKRAEQHRSVAAQLTGLRRLLDIHMMFPPETPEEMRAKLEELNKQISEATERAPTIQFERKTDSRGGGGTTSIMLSR